MKNPTLLTFALLASASPLLAQDTTPLETPTGEITVNHAMVRQGVAPKLDWNISYPSQITDLVTIVNGQITPKAPLHVTARVIGAAFDNGRYELPVRGYLQVGGAYQRIFQGTGSQVNPSQVLFSKALSTGESIFFKAEGAKNPQASSWYSTRYANGNEVKLLKNGDTPPGLEGVRTQASLETFLSSYIKNGKLALGPMDLIYAAELYSMDPLSSAYDLQDIVVLLRFEPLDEENSSYINYVTQTHVGSTQTPLRIDDVAPAGNATAPEGITGSSIFRLWAVHRTTGEEYLLDEKIVSSYHPEANITITTTDSYNGVPRTRVDQPFTVKYMMKGLVTNKPDAPDSAKSAILQSTLKNYRNAEEVSHTQSIIDRNGTTQQTRLTLIRASELTDGGEEEFTLFARPDYGVEESSMLAHAKVQVWPIAEGTLTGIDTSISYLRFPDFTINLKNLYPKSVTYVRVYAGPPNSNPQQATIVRDSYVDLDQADLGNRNFTLSGDKLGITQTGDHTVEILHTTPFGPEVLSQLHPVTTKNRIKVVGSLNSSE